MKKYNFNEHLFNTRKEAEFSKKEMAKSAKVSLMSYYRYESGERVPDVHTAQRIARKLNTTVEALFPLPEEQALKQKPDCSRTRKVS